MATKKVVVDTTRAMRDYYTYDYAMCMAFAEFLRLFGSHYAVEVEVQEEEATNSSAE